MAIQRIGIHKNKRSNAVKTQKREIAGFLSDGKEEKAKIRVEHIIREDFAIEGLEILELNLELVHERIKQISNNKECPAELKEAVCSIIWATNNVDIDELKEVTNQLTKKYGKEFAKQAMNNDNNCVNQRLYAKLSYRPPSKLLVKRYLEEIAKIYNVDWTPSPGKTVDFMCW
jgi:vacuolar protein sorting-associated protein IST1